MRARSKKRLEDLQTKTPAAFHVLIQDDDGMVREFPDGVERITLDEYHRRYGPADDLVTFIIKRAPMVSQTPPALALDNSGIFA